jgi:hypothetical protein
MVSLVASDSGSHFTSKTVVFPTNNVFAVANLSEIIGDFDSLAKEGFFEKQAPTGIGFMRIVPVDSYAVDGDYVPAVGKEFEKILTYIGDFYAYGHRRHCAARHWRGFPGREA